jgi:UDP-2,4-diacetamido-2,4,6-trideoxy-beta-L-altropyranose hydrolase
MRCLTLAAGLQANGAQVSFICRDLHGNYVDWLRERGHRVHLLPAPAYEISRSANEYLSWLGVPMEREIMECKEVINRGPAPHWIVVDHYALDQHWESEVLPQQSSLLVIDDLADRSHACQILLDQNYHPDANTRYADLAGEASLLLGPHYALLRPAFAANRRLVSQRSGDVRKLLVFLGGGDSANVTATVLKALAAFRSRALEVDVIVGQANPHLDEIATLCENIGAKLLRQVDDMAERMARADLAIGANGVATWERAAVGLPALTVSVADNQRAIARHADQLGILRWLGDAESVSEENWRQALDWAFSNPSALQAQSANGMRLVDGNGADRVVEKIIENHRCLH